MWGEHLPSAQPEGVSPTLEKVSRRPGVAAADPPPLAARLGALASGFARRATPGAHPPPGRNGVLGVAVPKTPRDVDCAGSGGAAVLGSGAVVDEDPAQRLGRRSPCTSERTTSCPQTIGGRKQIRGPAGGGASGGAGESLRIAQCPAFEINAGPGRYFSGTVVV